MRVADVRTFSAMGAIALATLAGCMATPSEGDAIRVSTWLPSAAEKYSSASLDGIEGGQPLDSTLARRPAVHVAALIGPPLAKSAPWPIRLFFSPASIEQAMLVKTFDNRYFSTAYVWRDNPIVGNCVEDLQQCARFEWPHQVSEDEAKLLLPRSWQFTPDLYHRFFGDDASVKHK